MFGKKTVNDIDNEFMFGKKTVNDIDIENKRVIHRVAFDVAMRKKGSAWEIVDDLRLKVIFPTLFDLLEHNCRVVLLSYMGRPQGKDKAFSLEPVAQRLSQLIARKVSFVADCVGEKVRKAADALAKREILLLENTRFYKEEYGDNPDFAKRLSLLGELFVQDAFSQCHRHHASVTGITQFLPSVAGLYLKEEVENLERLLSRPKRPLVVILGGAKISDKVKLLEKLVKIADYILVGGISGDVFLKAEGYQVGKLKRESYVLDQGGEGKDVIAIAAGLLAKTKKIILPVSRIAADNPKNPQKIEKVNFAKGEKVKDGWCLMDTGEETIKKFAPILQKAGTIFWNGPVGQIEMREFEKGTGFLLKEILKSKAVKFVSGGDTLRFVQKAGVLSDFDHFSAGGGASLSFLAGERLPGIEVLENKS